MTEEPTSNPSTDPRQERLPLMWDNQPAAPAVTRSGTAPSAAVKLVADSAADTSAAPAMLEKTEAKFPLTPKISPFRTPQTAMRPEFIEQQVTAPPVTPVQQPVAPAISPLAVSRLREVAKVLRAAREASQSSIAQISQKTKIPREFIENLENCAVASLPPPVYAKSYIRQLCREYDIDSAPLLDDYRLAIDGVPAPMETSSSDAATTTNKPVTGIKEGANRRQRPANTEKTENMSQNSSSKAVVVVVVILGIFAVLLLLVGLNKSGKSAAVKPGAQVDMTQFITPQTLPSKELAIPTSTGVTTPATAAPLAPAVN